MIVLINKNDEGYSRNRAVGNSYLNRFLIEEDTQFECAAVVDCTDNTLDDAKPFSTISNWSNLNWSNSDYICHIVISGVFFGILNYYDPRISSNQNVSFLITFTGSERLECIQKEQYEKFYTHGEQITSFLRTNAYSGTTQQIFTAKRDKYITDYPSEHIFFQLHKSFGDDIDDFYDRIKKKEIKCINKNSLEYRTLNEGIWDFPWTCPWTLFKGHLTVKTFHLSMLSETEERKICSGVSHPYQDTRYKIFDYFKNETALSNNMHNYALSLCARKTYYYEYKPDMFEYWDIDELDPWQEKIQKNFQEKKSANTRIHETPLFNYWELDSDSD